MTRGAWRLVVVAALALAPVTLTATAQAHGDDETQEAYVLVQQALAHLAHNAGLEGIHLAMEKVGDALETEDQEGVDVAEVEQGMHALEAGQADEARTLLQDSIADAVAGRPLATGYETGTSLVPVELPGREPLTGSDWLVLVLSLGVAGLGVWLSVRFRPRESVGALRLLLGTKPVTDDRPSRRIRFGRHPR
jgi:hypothetical protein